MAENRHLPQLDVIKCLAIISVVILHSIPTFILKETFYQFYIGQAVIILITLMGVTMVISFDRSNSIKLKKTLSLYAEYIPKRILRLGIHF
jgi:hypothetical protein